MLKVMRLFTIIFFMVSLSLQTAGSQEQAVPGSATAPQSILQNLEQKIPASIFQDRKMFQQEAAQQEKKDYKQEKQQDEGQQTPTEKQQVNYREEESEIERKFNKLYKDSLRNRFLSQFGYGFFSLTESEKILPVGDDYVLGPKDSIKIYLWGDPVDMLALSREIDLTVNREGNVYIPNLGVITVSGLTIGNLKNILRQKLGSKFRNLNIEVVLTNPRKFNVYITGFVNKPGMISVTPFDTLVTALAKAGGVSKSGSLRKVEIKRKDGNMVKVMNIDFYDLFIKGLPVDINLKDDDVIYVPPIGDIVAVSGDIKRPGIYELKNESSVKDIIEFAGGFNPSVSEVMVRISRYIKDGVKLLEGNLEDKEFLTTKLMNGDFVFFGEKPELYENSVFIQGEVYYPGSYSVNDTKTLKQLLTKAKPLVNSDYGKLVRVDKSVIDFKVSDIVQGLQDIELHASDNITIYNKYYNLDPVYLVGEVKSSKTIPFFNGITVIDILRNAEFNDRIEKLKLLVLRNQAIIKTIYLYDLLVRSDESMNMVLNPGDTLVVRKTEEIEKTPSVTILGEVKSPGKYMITGIERLSDIIKKAGGYTEKAYPQALIFIRESAKKLQKEKIDLTFMTLQEEFLRKSRGLAAASQEERAVYTEAIESTRMEIELLKKKAEFGLGRIALEIPKTLEELEKSNQNIQLQDGDTIIIPSKPNYILVLGDVYNEISLPYIEGYSLKDYISMVGGYRKDADKKGVYIIRANGRVVSQDNFSRGFMIGSGIEDYKLAEGDTIVVPAEIKVPVMWRPLIRDIVQIVFQSIATAVLAKRL